MVERMSNNDSAERNGKQIRPSNYINTMDLNSLGNCDWTCVDWDDWDKVSKNGPRNFYQSISESQKGLRLLYF